MLPNQTVTVLYILLCHPFPNQLATSCGLHGRFLLFLRHVHSSSPMFGELLTTSRIFPLFYLFTALVSIIPSNDLCGHYGSTFRRAALSVDLPIAWVKGRLPRVWCQSLGTETIVVPPPNGVALPSTLGKKGDSSKNPQRKDYIIIAVRT